MNMDNLGKPLPISADTDSVGFPGDKRPDEVDVPIPVQVPITCGW
jgi:hypothetical protein